MNLRLSQEFEAQTVLALEPEELGHILLEKFVQLSVTDYVRRDNLANDVLQDSGYPQHLRQGVAEAVMEAWCWLEHAGLIRPQPETSAQSWHVSRRGRLLRNKSEFETYRKASLLPMQLLHPTIAQKIKAPFGRGEYDTCVFIAFREVEVTVRQAGKFSPTDIGTGLMRKAFNIESGPLTDGTAVDAEKQALSDLFAGAIGYYKNPGSHRNVVITADEAVELICLASRLIKTVELRAGNSKGVTTI
jgi:uncharacterized protein (TIGR02391 family)